MADIAGFVATESTKPFRWGSTDCSATADRWVRTATGISPFSVYGRVHRNQHDAKEWLAEPGGIAVAMNRIMRSAGFKKTIAPSAGDIGLIVHAGKLCVAIHTGSFWFSRDESGLIGEPLTCRLFKAWKII